MELCITMKMGLFEFWQIFQVKEKRNYSRIKLIFGELENVNKKLEVLNEIKETQIKMLKILEKIEQKL